MTDKADADADAEVDEAKALARRLAESGLIQETPHSLVLQALLILFGGIALAHPCCIHQAARGAEVVAAQSARRALAQGAEPTQIH